MTRDVLLQRIQVIRDQGNRALGLLETKPQTATTIAEARSILIWIKSELHNEFLRTAPEKAQKTMTLFELCVYVPTIEEAWKLSGISRLKTDAMPSKKWSEVLEAVVYTAWKYIA